MTKRHNVRRQSGEAFHPDCIVERVKHPTYSTGVVCHICSWSWSFVQSGRDHESTPVQEGARNQAFASTSGMVSGRSVHRVTSTPKCGNQAWFPDG